MATLTGILASAGGGGGGGKSAGESANLVPADVYGTNPTLGTVEYLHTANVKQYVSDYADLKKTPLLCFKNVAANANVLILNANANLVWSNTTIYGSGTGPGAWFKLEKSNTDFIRVGYPQWHNNGETSTLLMVWKYGPNVANLATGNANTPVMTGPSVTNWGVSAWWGGSGYFDSLSYKGRVVIVGGRTFLSSYFIEDNTFTLSANAFIYATNTNSFTRVAQTAFGQIFSGDNSGSPKPNTHYYYGIASNGELLVTHTREVAQVSGRIATSTDGLTWTNRTMSGAPAVEVRRFTYSNAGNCFIFITENSNVYTSTDGFTLTSRTAPPTVGGLANVVCNVTGQSMYSATSNSNTIILLNSNTMIHTQNGVSYGYRNMDLDSNLRIFKSEVTQPNTLSIVYYQNKFIISNYSGKTVYSDDDGVNWKLDFVRYNQNLNNVVANHVGWVSQSVLDGNLYCINYNTSSGNNFPVDASSTIAQTNPDYVGTTGLVAGYYTILKV